LALSKGVLTTTETLRAILEKEQRERMEKEEIEKCTTCTKGCDHKRLPKAINMPYLDQIGIIRGEDGIFRSSKCGSEDVRNGRCKNCRNKKSNLRESQWTKLMEPPAPDGPIKSDDGLAVAELKGQVRQRIEVLNKQGKMNEIATDPILNDAAILLSHREAYVIHLGNGTAFSICKCSTTYGSAVGNKQMKSCCSLDTNGWYAKEQVGPLLVGSSVGPNEVIQYHQYCRNKAKEYAEKSLGFDHAPPARVFQDIELDHFDQLQDFEKDIVNRLKAMELEKGFMQRLMMLRGDYFSDWLRLTLQTDHFDWFRRTINSTTDVGGSKEFDTICRRFMTKYLKLTVLAIKSRSNNDRSYEYDFHQFLLSDELNGFVATSKMPWFAKDRPCCVVLALSLNRLMEELVDTCSISSALQEVE
ncbi:hypothetical protein THAOC_25614, partial [Thalassiosira oceanica]